MEGYFLAISRPCRCRSCLSLYLADPTYEPFDGESRAHTMHWLYNMKGMGRVDLSTTADIPTYAVFTQGQDTTYIAYNAGAVERTVHFLTDIA